MNQESEQTPVASPGRNPFWVCLAVFLVLALDNGIRLGKLMDQRRQFNAVAQNQAQNAAQLAQQQQFEVKLQAFSLDLLQLAATNATAKQIVQEFKIQWNPGTNAPVPAAGNPPAAQ